MTFDGIFTNDQFFRDLTIGQAISNQFQYIQFALGQFGNLITILSSMQRINE